MRQFEVDDEVIKVVWEKASPAPFESLSFNDALRRVLGMSRPLATRPAANSTEPSFAQVRTRAPKADLKEMVSSGLLKEGQELIFVDYKGHLQTKHRAKVAGGHLLHNKVRYSMSALASLLLKQIGYTAESVRGPDHWATEDGQRIRTLWESALSGRVQH